jgi:hypothetical protein
MKKYWFHFSFIHYWRLFAEKKNSILFSGMLSWHLSKTINPSRMFAKFYFVFNIYFISPARFIIILLLLFSEEIMFNAFWHMRKIVNCLSNDKYIIFSLSLPVKVHFFAFFHFQYSFFLSSLTHNSNNNDYLLFVIYLLFFCCGYLPFFCEIKFL